MHYNNMSLGDFAEYAKEAERQEREQRIRDYNRKVEEITQLLLEDHFRELLNEK